MGGGGRCGSFGSSSNKTISELYLNRKAPIKPFEEKIVSVCNDLLSSTALNTFFKGLNFFPFKRFPSLVKITSVRYFNTLNNNRDEFKEWLCGFIDSEGSFYIEPNNKGRSYRFNFQIVLHIDDIEVLHFIKSKLGMGEVRDRGSNAIFTIRAQQDIVELIEILSKYPLNSKKYLDFSDFKRAFELYTNSKTKTPELILDITLIKDGMNKGRTKFSMPIEHKYRITPYWLLGFVEGDGSFFIRRKNYQLYFSIAQHSRDLELINKIADFLYDLPTVNKQIMRKSSLRISESSAPTVLPLESSPLCGNSSKNSATYLVVDHSD